MLASPLVLMFKAGFDVLSSAFRVCAAARTGTPNSESRTTREHEPRREKIEE